MKLNIPSQEDNNNGVIKITETINIRSHLGTDSEDFQRLEAIVLDSVFNQDETARNKSIEQLKEESSPFILNRIFISDYMILLDLQKSHTENRYIYVTDVPNQLRDRQMYLYESTE